MKKQKKNVTYIGIITLILILSVLAWFISKPEPEVQTTVTKSEETQRFTSKNLEIAFDTKTPVLMKDLLISVILDYDGKEILISRSSSDYQKLEDYLARLIELNQLNVKQRKDITIDGSPAVILFTDSMGVDHPSYFVVKDEWVYSMYTIHPELFDDLDRIVKTFDYLSDNSPD